MNYITFTLHIDFLLFIPNKILGGLDAFFSHLPPFPHEVVRRLMPIFQCWHLFFLFLVMDLVVWQKLQTISFTNDMSSVVHASFKNMLLWPFQPIMPPPLHTWLFAQLLNLTLFRSFGEINFVNPCSFYVWNCVEWIPHNSTRCDP